MQNIEKIKWSDKFKIGINEVDLQHEYFVLLINRLIDELKESIDIGYKHRLLEELSLYASFHFTSEENMMVKNGYPNVKDHKILHRKLLSSLNDRINYYKLSKETEASILGFLVDWFIHHTAEQDKAFGLFINQIQSL